MTDRKANIIDVFWLIALLLYSIILILGSIYPRGYAPPNYHFTLLDNARLAVPIVHVFLTWISILKWKFQKWVLLVNLCFCFTIMSALLWMLRSNDVNVFIVILMVIWVLLVRRSIGQWRSLKQHGVLR
jgi:hypothetical protein